MRSITAVAFWSSHESSSVDSGLITLHIVPTVLSVGEARIAPGISPVECFDWTRGTNVLAIRVIHASTTSGAEGPILWGAEIPVRDRHLGR